MATLVVCTALQSDIILFLNTLIKCVKSLSLVMISFPCHSKPGHTRINSLLKVIIREFRFFLVDVIWAFRFKIGATDDYVCHRLV